MRPLIGLIPLYDDEKKSYWMLPGYMKVLEQCGALPLMLPLTEEKEELEQCISLCDGLLFTGGHDVDPEIYGMEPLPECGIPCPPRDHMEQYLLTRAAAEDKAVFGICRGVQFINAAFGGSLYQDLPTEHQSSIEHHMRPPYNRTAHTVTILPDSPLEKILNCSSLEVNSYHHQAIRELAPMLQPMAVSPDGLIEAVWVPGKHFIMAVQWHPEFSYTSDANSIRLMQAFTDACRK